MTSTAAETVRLLRDCDSIRIPSGAYTLLERGSEVSITQSLGGSFTVSTPAGLFRVAAENADALGLSSGPEAAPAGPFEEPMLWDALKTCFDPEIPVNIVDLGLVYDLRSEELPGGTRRVIVKMTLTAPGCGMGPSIAKDAESKLLAVPTVSEARVELVWDPQWNPGMITADGRARLGME